MNIEKVIDEIVESGLDVKIYRDKSVKNFNTIRIGGKANCIIEVKNLKHFIFIIRKVQKNNIPYKIIGFGANILFADSYYNGIIIVTKGLCGYNIKDDKITAEAGISLPRLSQIAINNSLSGLESFRILPSTIAGAVINNVSCFNNEIKSYIKSVIYLENGVIKRINGLNFTASYHKTEFFNNKIILKVVLKLEKKDRKEIEQKTNELIKRKRESQPLNEKSLGSIFRRGENYFPAKIIDEMGLKGLKVGDAKISNKHAGFFVNVGKCTFDDMKSLIEIVKEKVFLKHNINLQEEIEYFGE